MCNQNYRERGRIGVKNLGKGRMTATRMHKGGKNDEVENQPVVDKFQKAKRVARKACVSSLRAPHHIVLTIQTAGM